MTIKDKASVVLGKAKEWASDASSWMEYSNKLFAEPEGLVPKTFPRMTERKEFYNLPEYEQINDLLAGLIGKFGIDEGRGKKKSGKFLVRLPKTLHHRLEIEAQDEGVSLNQLATVKLATPLKDSESIFRSRVIEAFTRVYDGYSSDRVIVHPDLNDRFLKECRRLGLDASDYDLNHKLQDIRKSGNAELPPATKKPVMKDYDEFLFSSEIAFRYLQQKENVSLDDVLCDTALRSRFDSIAQNLSPNEKNIFKLRMGALYLRKKHRLKPEDAGMPSYEFLSAGTIKEVKLNRLPDFPGMYAFYDSVRPVFAGQTAKLRHRIDLHLGSAKNLFLPSWLEYGREDYLELRYIPAQKVTAGDRLKWLNRFINREHPVFNYQEAA
jgi:site-specific DNA-methyltransferase (adenine-specific)